MQKYNFCQLNNFVHIYLNLYIEFYQTAISFEMVLRQIAHSPKLAIPWGELMDSCKASCYLFEMALKWQTL